VELDGQHHVGQPVRDARRETMVVALTGWLCGRFAWDDLRRRPSTTRGRLTALAGQARRRPVA
jgi:very-short-patch-repair endonuclease